MQIRPATTADLDAMAALAAVLQAEGTTHIGYLGEEAESIATDVAGIDSWTERSVVALAHGVLVGWLTGEKDEEMGRAWWWGPFCVDRPDRDRIADAMYDLASSVVAANEQELAPDERNSWVAQCAARWGFHGETASAVLRYEGVGFGVVDGVTDLTPDEANDVIALHDRLFPGTHTTGRTLVASDDPRMVYLVDGRVGGYVAAEVQSGRAGYIDYLGVDPDLRGRGIGRELVRAAGNRMLELGAVSVNLTVREDNTTARRLYVSLGFVEERVIRPYRKGFSLES